MMCMHIPTVRLVVPWLMCDRCICPRMPLWLASLEPPPLSTTKIQFIWLGSHRCLASVDHGLVDKRHLFDSVQDLGIDATEECWTKNSISPCISISSLTAVIISFVS